MSRSAKPKQLLPLIRGKSLLALAWERLEGLIPVERRWVCAGEQHSQLVRETLPGLHPDRWLGEPVGRDTLSALAYASAAIARTDPDATVCVLTADHLIEPGDEFRAILADGCGVAEGGAGILVTFGVAPTHPATGFGYLRLGARFGEHARVVVEFKEKPDALTAAAWVAEGPEHFLWNSGMFVWKADVFLGCVSRYEPDTFASVTRIAEARGTPGFAGVIASLYPLLRKISVDYAVMEKASHDPAATVAALPMALRWMDIGSWPAFADTCAHDEAGNSRAAEKCLLLDTSGTLVVSSDPAHLVAAFGCEDLVIVHTPTATLVCRRDRAEDLKKLQSLAAERFGPEYV
jgi:mannose-1-phosphate guanylyltransferase